MTLVGHRNYASLSHDIEYEMSFRSIYKMDCTGRKTQQKVQIERLHATAHLLAWELKILKNDTQKAKISTVHEVKPFLHY